MYKYSVNRFIKNLAVKLRVLQKKEFDILLDYKKQEVVFFFCFNNFFLSFNDFLKSVKS